ncbi:MAG: hypothetical protein M5U16_02130 [Hyphomicrobium sp.]|nr:hypothetical protein [Hyphomicrobium sp.]
MNVAAPFANSKPEDIMTELAGGKLVIYSVARPPSADAPVERSGVLATFTFASPAFVEAGGKPAFEANPVKAVNVGTPGFARAFKADGSTVVADFSVGPGATEIKLSEVSTVADFPIAIRRFQLPT